MHQQDLYFRYPELTHGEDGLFMYEVTLVAPVTVETDEVLYFYRVHSGSADNSVSLENRQRKIRSHIRITQILHQHFLALEHPKDDSADKLMVFLWLSLYDICQLPSKEAKTMLQELRKDGLFPFHRPAQCGLRCSCMTDRTDFVGRVFDKVYLNLHTRWGYTAMQLLQKLR